VLNKKGIFHIFFSTLLKADLNSNFLEKVIEIDDWMIIFVVIDLSTFLKDSF